MPSSCSALAPGTTRRSANWSSGTRRGCSTTSGDGASTAKWLRTARRRCSSGWCGTEAAGNPEPSSRRTCIESPRTTGSTSTAPRRRLLLKPACRPGARTTAASSARSWRRGGRAPEERASDEELAGRIRAAVEQLSDQQKSVFLMAETRGLRYADIGEALGIPVGTVKSRNARRRATFEGTAVGGRRCSLAVTYATTSTS